MKCFLLLILMCFLYAFSENLYISGEKSLDFDKLSAGDSVLFKRGERFFTTVSLAEALPNNLYFGSFGDTLLPKPIIDGSIYRFRFDAKIWKDFELIKGVRFYKKYIKGLNFVENVYADRQILTMAREPDENEEVVTGQRNSFVGFFMIDSVCTDEPKKKFYDFSNTVDWSGGDIVAKTQQWSYEIRKINKSPNGEFQLEENTQDVFRKNWGYFVQRHKSALDQEGEWFYDEKEGVLYFSPEKEECMIYVSGNDENSSGIVINNTQNIKIENLIFTSSKFGIKLEKTGNITIKGCEFYNCTYGIINKRTHIKNITVKKCIFRNLKSYGIILRGDNIRVSDNHIDSIGLSLSCDSRGYNNLNAIEVYGDNNNISDNKISNIGFCAVRFNGDGSVVANNVISDAGLMMADVGGIYSWHSMDGNKRISKNIISNVRGNVDGTTGEKDHGRGIYLDELSLHFKIDSNTVTKCGGGIYIQNSRSDTVVNNYTKDNARFELQFNHATGILNGGRLNPENDPDFNPDNLTTIPEGYIWDRDEGLLFYKNKKNGVVYVEPGNNLVRDNIFIPDKGKNKYSFHFKTWQNLNSDIIRELTGNDDFFYNNIPDSLVNEASVLFHVSNVKDLRHDGKIFEVIRNDLDKKAFNFLRNMYVWIGWGIKYDIEMIRDER